MADTENLRTASLYINNQLLSRGLLRDDETLDFSNPGNNEGGTAATMARIMGIVNDLILRRDRDAEQRESLSVAMRTLRADGLRQTNDLTRLTEKFAETERKLNLAEASESALRTQLKSVEATVRGLKEEVARAKSLVAQTRASCATEVRRRDRQIDTLKKQLNEATRSRGAVKNPAIAVINVTGDVGLEKGSPSQAGSTANDGYDLRSETNEFLTELAKGLSEENEKLLFHLRRLRDDLKTMSGWERGVVEGDDHAVSVIAGVSELESDLKNILDHLRTILTNPSFVPLEEVVTREEEISRLRDGWTKMETRWKEAVHLIDGWRRRMASNGRPVNEEELKMGLRLSPVRVKDVEETTYGMDLRLPAVQEEEEEEEEEEEAVDVVRSTEEHVVATSPCPVPTYETAPTYHNHLDVREDDSDSESSVYDDGVNIEDYDVDEPNVQILEQSAAIIQPSHVQVDSSPLPVPPQLSPLKDSESAGNRGTLNEPRARSKSIEYAKIAKDETCELLAGTPEPQSGWLRKEPTTERPHIRTVTASINAARAEEAATKDAELDSSASSLDSLLLDSPSKKPTQTRTRTTAAKPRQAPTTRPREVVASRPVRPVTATSRETRASTAKKSNSPVEQAQHKGVPTPAQSSTKRVNSRLPILPMKRLVDPAPQQSPLTMAAIAAKLAASEREADAARVRAKLKAARMAKRKPDLAPAPADEAEMPVKTAQGSVDPVKKDPVQHGEAPEKRGDEAGDAGESEAPPKRKREKRASKVASRRRSTLSPWELESLISGNVAASPAK
ncbi:hypothetical protein jhhlp_006248 [Lomentospora prolificans]|uniref:NIMA interactive protein n=1 Tax=Lomentospora prolificans TaxID=41688 RepID=A0A2N3N5J1_9PEZI|nr:hypothetical protein jhhlp_006248 [Lomentospora prolificans]